MNGYYLTLNLSIAPFGFALFNDHGLIYQQQAHDSYRFSETIIDTISSACDQHHLRLSHCQGIAVVHGPGSYTGTRIAISTTNTLSRLCSCPILGCHALDMIVHCMYPAHELCVAVIPSRKHEVTYALYSAAQADKKMSLDIVQSYDQFCHFLSQFESSICVIGPLPTALEQRIRDIKLIRFSARYIQHDLLFEALTRYLSTSPSPGYITPLYLHAPA